MKDWYQTREGATAKVYDRGFEISVGKKVYLSKEAATVHGSNLVKTTAPTSREEIAVAEDFEVLEKKETPPLEDE